MAKKNSTKTAKKEALQASEPSLLTFRDWRGMNIAETPLGWDANEGRGDYRHFTDADGNVKAINNDNYRQTKLQSNFLELANNVLITPSGSIETRPPEINISMWGEESITYRDGQAFSGPVAFDNEFIYAAFTDGSIGRRKITDNALTDTLANKPRNTSWAFTWVEFNAIGYDIDESGNPTDTQVSASNFISGPIGEYGNVNRLPDGGMIWTSMNIVYFNKKKYLIAFGYPKSVDNVARFIYSNEASMKIDTDKTGRVFYRRITDDDDHWINIDNALRNSKLVDNPTGNVKFSNKKVLVTTTDKDPDTGATYSPSAAYLGDPSAENAISAYTIYTCYTNDFGSTLNSSGRTLGFKWDALDFNFDRNITFSGGPYTGTSLKASWDNDPFHKTSTGGRIPFGTPMCSPSIVDDITGIDLWASLNSSSSPIMIGHVDITKYSDWYREEVLPRTRKMRSPLISINTNDDSSVQRIKYYNGGTAEFVSDINIYKIKKMTLYDLDGTDSFDIDVPFDTNAGTYIWVAIPQTGSSSTMISLSKLFVAWKYKWVGSMIDTTEYGGETLSFPEINTTNGPKASYCDQIDGRVWYWGNPDEPYRAYWGGTAMHELSTATGLGGGFMDIEPGFGGAIKGIVKYKTASGASIPTALCSNSNSTKIRRYNLIEEKITATSELAVSSWKYEHVANVLGCNSPYGYVRAEDGLYAVNRYGISVITQAMEYNSQLKEQYITDNIKPLFTDDLAVFTKDARLMYSDGMLYCMMARRNPALTDKMNPELEPYENNGLDSMILCYDMASKCWTTWDVYEDMNQRSVPADGKRIKHIFPIDYWGFDEGIAIMREDGITMIRNAGYEVEDYCLEEDNSTGHKEYKLKRFLNENQNDVEFNGRKLIIHPKVKIRTAEIGTTNPLTQFIYLDQLDFRFDYIITDENGFTIQLDGVDYYGRHIHVEKKVTMEFLRRNFSFVMKIGMLLESFRITMEGVAYIKLTHFIGKIYRQSNRIKMPYGFNDKAGYIDHNGQEKYEQIHHRVKSYNNLREAIVT